MTCRLTRFVPWCNSQPCVIAALHALDREGAAK